MENENKKNVLPNKKQINNNRKFAQTQQIFNAISQACFDDKIKTTIKTTATAAASTTTRNEKQEER